MAYDDAIKALSNDALKFVKDNYVIGLGSGRAATAPQKSIRLSTLGLRTRLQLHASQQAHASFGKGEHRKAWRNATSI